MHTFLTKRTRSDTIFKDLITQPKEILVKRPMEFFGPRVKNTHAVLRRFTHLRFNDVFYFFSNFSRRVVCSCHVKSFAQNQMHLNNRFQNKKCHCDVFHKFSMSPQQNVKPDFQFNFINKNLSSMILTHTTKTSRHFKILYEGSILAQFQNLYIYEGEHKIGRN